MQPLEHNPGAIGIGSQVVANGVRGLATGTAAGAEASALAPAGAEEVSMQAALAFATEAMQTMAINALAQEELSRAGAAYVEAAGVYTAADESSATTLL
ncbi:PE domain-containing protein [Mycobacterium sp. NPDC006124]|uniref:PE domain-containing protein n=1 Tax=Mycobacterium sp. NPDC006124 TaxID=3156729 RepID=UPI0033AD2B15